MFRFLRFYRFIYMALTIFTVLAAVWTAVRKRQRTMDRLKQVLKNLRNLKDFDGLKNMA